MKFINAIYYGEDFRFHRGSVEIKDGVITSVSDESAAGPEEKDIVDCDSNYLIPGLVDIHIHGNSGADFSDGDPEGLKRMAGYLAKNGITSFSPASMTLPEKEIEKAFRTAADFRRMKRPGYSKLQGITMEGPFLSEKYRGAQYGKYLTLPDVGLFERLNAVSGGLVRIVCIAPELDGAIRFIREASKSTAVALAHTESDYETARRAFGSGAKHLTHMFNAMPPMLHRAPGVIGAAADEPDVTAELICDGVHVHESMVRTAFRIFGRERIVLVSDAMRACGMEDGVYTLGWQEITKTGNRSLLKDGTIAGSVTNLFECMKNCIGFGIAAEDAVRAATYNPAAVLGIQKEIGFIGEGKRADLVLCNREYEIIETYIDGRPVMK